MCWLIYSRCNRPAGVPGRDLWQVLNCKDLDNGLDYSVRPIYIHMNFVKRTFLNDVKLARFKTGT